MGQLDRSQKVRFAELEKRIEQGMETWMDVGRALAEIRDTKLYRDEFLNFSDYLTQRWGMSKTHANRLIKADGVVRKIEKAGKKPPKSERVVREAAKDPDPVEALDEAEAQHGPSPSASQVAETVRKRASSNGPSLSDLVKRVKERVGSAQRALDDIRTDSRHHAEAVEHLRSAMTCLTRLQSEDDDDF